MDRKTDGTVPPLAFGRTTPDSVCRIGNPGFDSPSLPTSGGWPRAGPPADGVKWNCLPARWDPGLTPKPEPEELGASSDAESRLTPGARWGSRPAASGCLRPGAPPSGRTETWRQTVGLWVLSALTPSHQLPLSLPHKLLPQFPPLEGSLLPQRFSHSFSSQRWFSLLGEFQDQLLRLFSTLYANETN